MRERDIERALVKGAKELGGEVRKVVWQGRRGAPDRVLMLPVHASRGGPWSNCRSIWVELKAPGVEPKSHQLREHKRMRAVGQIVVVIDSIEGVQELLR